MNRFEELLCRWNKASSSAIAYSLASRTRDFLHRTFIARQLREAANSWYSKLLAEVAQARRQRPELLKGSAPTCRTGEGVPQ